MKIFNSETSATSIINFCFEIYLDLVSWFLEFGAIRSFARYKR